MDKFNATVSVSQRLSFIDQKDESPGSDSRPDRPVAPHGHHAYLRPRRPHQPGPETTRVAAQVTGEFPQLVPFAAHPGVLAGEGNSPGGLTSDGSATSAVQH